MENTVGSCMVLTTGLNFTLHIHWSTNLLLMLLWYLKSIFSYNGYMSERVLATTKNTVQFVSKQTEHTSTTYKE